MNLPACKAEMDKFSKGLLYQIVPNKSFSNVCYTYRISNRLAGSVYRIALNDQLPEELQEWLKTIEFAHIKLQHYAKHQSLDFKFSAPKIRAVYEKLKPLFDDPVQDVDNMYDIFEDYIFKMLRDWECLTKYFTEEEVRYLDTLYPEECIIDGKPVYHMLPQDVGYPPGLTANEYLLLILQNPEEWFMNQAQAQAQANQRNRQQNNGTQGGCNTNQSSSSSGGQPDESDMNHNKEEKDKPKKNNQQQNGQNGQNGQSGQNGQQNQQQQNQNQNGSQNGQQNQQPQQGMGTDQQNQDAAANTQTQDWKDAKNQNENSGSQNKGGSSSNNKDEDTEDRDSQSAGSSGGQSKSDDKSESGSDGVGGGSSSESEDGENKNSNGGSSSKNGESSDDESGDANSSGGSDAGGESAEDEQTANGGGNSEDGEQSKDGETGSSSGSDESSESGEDLSGDGNESEDGSNSESEAEGDNTDQSGKGGDSQDSEDGMAGEEADGDVEEPHQPTKEELEEMIKNFVQKLVTDYQKMMETKAEQSAAQNQEIAGYSRGGGGGQGTVLADGCSNWVDFEGLEKEVKELLINRSITTSKRDLLYNYNRGRGCGDVLTPRYREETRYEDVPMTVILDVSGSISEKNILGFCNIFKNVSKMVDKKCTIVLWDTELRAIFDSRDEIKAVSGGGTDIGAGINYVKKQMQPSDIGNLFVVSDCCDNLEEWNLEGFDTSYLVCWSGMNAIEQYAGNKFNEFCGQFEKILVKND